MVLENAVAWLDFGSRTGLPLSLKAGRRRRPPGASDGATNGSPKFNLVTFTAFNPLQGVRRQREILSQGHHLLFLADALRLGPEA